MCILFSIIFDLCSHGGIVTALTQWIEVFSVYQGIPNATMQICTTFMKTSCAVAGAQSWMGINIMFYALTFFDIALVIGCVQWFFYFDPSQKRQQGD